MITRCVCLNLTFEEILNWSKDNSDYTLSGVRKNLKAGTRCQRCVPYIKESLRTKETKFK